MALPFFTDKKETPVSLRQKAEALLARSDDVPISSQGRQSSGENRLKRSGFEGDFRQFRDYRPGDRPQDIDWKRSARSDDTLVKEREKTQQRILDLYIQNYPGMHFQSSSKWPTKYETAGIIGTAFALWAARHHNPVYFWSHKIGIDELPSTILKQTTPPRPEWRKNALTILIGDYIDQMEYLEPVLSNISSPQVILLQTFDPAELDLPYHGRHFFEDGSAKTVVNDPDGIRNDYKTNLDHHLKSLQNYCRNRNWHYDLIRTDQDMVISFNRALAWIGDFQ